MHKDNIETKSPIKTFMSLQTISFNQKVTKQIVKNFRHILRNKIEIKVVVFISI